MKSSWKVFFVGVAAVFCLSGAAAAEEWIILGTRALGMGGAGVAVANDAMAPHWNPAGLTRRPGFDLEIPIGVKLGVEGGLIGTADELYDAVAEEGDHGYTLEGALDELSKSNTEYPTAPLEETAYAKKTAALGDILATLNNVPELNREGQGALVDLYSGLFLRYRNFGFSVAGLGYGAVDPYVNLDVASGWNLIGGVLGTVDVAAQFEQLYGTSLENVGGNELTTDGAQLASNVASTLQSVDPSLTDEEATNAANELVYLAEEEGVDTSDPTIQTIIQNIAQGTGEVTGSGSSTAGTSALANNSAMESDVFSDSAGVTIKGLLIQEYRATYARSFFDENLSVGVNLKALEGETRYVKYNMQDLVGGEDLVADINKEENAKTTSQFDADIGILYTPFKRLSVGLVVKHLASPEFEYAPGSGADSVKLEPQARLGVGLMPFSWLTLAADMDLTTNESEILDGYKSRQVGAGAELKIWFLTLRGGGYNNIESDETGLVYTAGLGIRIWKFAFEGSGAMAAEEQEIGSGEETVMVRDRYSFAGAFKFSTAF